MVAKAVHDPISSSEEWMQSLLFGGQIDHSSRSNDKPLKRRIVMLSAFLVIVLLALAVRLFYMQIVRGSDYSALASGNRIRLLVDYAPRGNIYDRNGVVLAENSLGFQLSATPYLLNRDEAQRQADINHVATILAQSAEELQAILSEQGWDYVLPIPLASELSHEEAVRLGAILPDLKGFEIEEVPLRRYRSDSALAHIIGYTSRVSPTDLAADDGGLLPTDFIGRTGIEQYYDGILRGQNGYRRIEVDALGRPIRVLSRQEPKAGQDIYLTIDYQVQNSLVSGLKEQMKKANSSKAAAVATDPRDGSVIAMVSLPSYDNNLFSGRIDEKTLQSLTNNSDQPLYNKAISGGYTTGSIIKPLVASAALQEGVVDENSIIVDTGAIALPGGYIFRGWRPGGLGPMNIRSAIAWSSNIYFYTVGGGYGSIGGLGVERLTSYYRMFGLGEKTGLDLANEISGRVPDEVWKLSAKDEAWYVGDTYNISIGQGDLLITPLQINLAHDAIANNGYLLQPHLLLDGEKTVRRELSVDKKYLQIVREGMRQVLTSGTTCECTFSNVPVRVAGKTGTAETDTEGGRRPHAWFSAFAPYESPEILITVIIEEGVGGSAYAAPAIAQALQTYFGEQ